MFSLFKYKILLLMVLQFFILNIAKAKECNVEPSGWITIDILGSSKIKTSNNPNIDQGSSFNIGFINVTNMNLEAFIQSTQTSFVTIKLINLDFPNLIVISKANFYPKYKKDITLIGPSTSVSFASYFFESDIKKITNGKPANILAVVSVGTYLRYPGSSEPIGIYKNGKFEPTYFHCSQEFHLTYK